jgi:membrane protein YdbS with pleckstrin-like domain
MFDDFRKLLLRLFRVPPEPDPPAGASGSVQVFRAAHNYYKLRLLGWGLSQLAALAGFLFAFVLLTQATAHLPAKMRASAQVILGILWLLKSMAIVAYLLQIPVTYALQRLDYEMRWYMVTDRSLRIRAGIWNVQEMTMSFANLQQITVTQGPLQRLLGIADVRVVSAGGGGGGTGSHGEHSTGLALHTGYFHGVDNAGDIRDLIVDRLRHFRETGLGDPDEHRSGALAVPAASSEASVDAAKAAQELLEEVRALRAALRA